MCTHMHNLHTYDEHGAHYLTIAEVYPTATMGVVGFSKN